MNKLWSLLRRSSFCYEGWMTILTLITVTVFVVIFNYIGCGGGGGDTGSSFAPPASPAPSLTTNPATNITQNSARLHGTVDPNGVGTNAYFQYGGSTSYGTNTSYQNVGSGNVAVNISEDITGLALNTQYNYRIRAIRSDGTFNGLNQTFTTIKPPPACTTNPATNVTNNSAKLNGLVNPNGLAADIHFEYGISVTPITYPLSTTAQAIGSGTSNVAVSATVSSLAIITQYDFRVVGTNSTGTTYGDNRKFMTGNTSGSAPTCATDSVTDITVNSAVLYGTVNPNERDTIAYFEYGLNLSYGITTTNQSIGSGNMNIAVSDTAGSLVEETLYNFRVVGTSSGGTSQGSNMTFTTLGNTPICTTNDATNIAATSAKLNGIVNPNGFNVTSCYFQYGFNQPAYGSIANVSPLPGSGTAGVTVSATASSLAAVTQYNFRVVATNSRGTTNGNNKTFTTTAIPAPTCTTNNATNVTGITAILNGTVNPNGFNVTSCIFEYGTTGNYNLSATATPSPGSGTSNVAVSATISGLTEVTGYNFRVVAANAGGSTTGNSVTFTTTAAFSATGGLVTTSGGYTFHTFKSNGTFQVTAGSRNVEVLVVAGGGGGGGQSGNNGNGGGGAGGLIYNASFAVSLGSYSVTVGAGGAGSSPPTNGGNSVFSSLTAIGGGSGGHGSPSTAATVGGSGGGGCSSTVATGAAGTPGQGNAGGTGDGTGPSPAGGGGGAGAPGTNGSPTGGAGGVGLQYPQFASVGGSPAGWFAGGGGASCVSGASPYNSPGVGGQGGGGNGSGSSGSPAGSAGTVNTGGGGGGGRDINGYAGGSGIVIIRYLTP